MPIMMKKYPNQELLKELFNYKNGRLYWTKNNKLAGGYGHSRGYGRVRILIDEISNLYYTNRLTWIWHNGEIPEGMQVDHKDLNVSNDDIDNLQLLTHEKNLKKHKMSPHNKSGVHGVHWYSKSGKWRASIKDKDKYIHIGYYHNIDDALKARKEAEVKYGYDEIHGTIR